MEHRELETPPVVLDPSTPIARELENPMSHAELPQTVSIEERVERPVPGWEVVTSFTPQAGPDDEDEPTAEPVADPIPAMAPGLHPCLCGTYEVVDPANDNAVVAETVCGKVTKGRFAPGHDAKLKSLLISAGVHGHRVRDRAKGPEALFKPMTVANRFAFAAQVKKAIEARRRSW